MLLYVSTTVATVKKENRNYNPQEYLHVKDLTGEMRRRSEELDRYLLLFISAECWKCRSIKRKSYNKKKIKDEMCSASTSMRSHKQENNPHLQSRYVKEWKTCLMENCPTGI